MPEELEIETPEGAQDEQPKPAAGSEPVLTEKDEEEKPKGGFQRKIDKLTGRNYELEALNQELRKRLDSIEERIAAKPAAEAKKEEAADPRPDFKNWTGSVEEYYEALTRWATRQELKSHTAKSEKERDQQEAQEAEKEIYQAYQERIVAFKEEHEDFNEVVNRIHMSKTVGEAVQVAIVEDDSGPALAYYLGQHPEICKELDKLSPARAVVRLGRIAAQLVPESAASEEKPDPKEELEEQEEESSPPPKPKSSAPAPISPVRKPAPTATGLSDDLSDSEWMRRREKQLRG